MGAPPDLPSRFPCWVRATYSWGGETKRDLGFVEGDLIEALNAGDGLWWMGRLRRDPRAIGMFPSTFSVVREDRIEGREGGRPTRDHAGEAQAQEQLQAFLKHEDCAGAHRNTQRTKLEQPG
jgi:transglutaminase/protease-like cytokinesis protein 3